MLDKSLWKRFLANECTAEEADFVTNYLKVHPEELDRLLPEAEWDEIERLHQSSHLEKPKSTVLRSRFWFYKAAIALLCLGLLTLFYQQKTTITKKSIELVQLDSLPSRWEIKINRSTKPLRLTLEDGSEIRLGQNSQIEYPTDFKSNRHIRLSGKATFDVAKDSAHPFSVFAGELETKVLGTAFEIIAYAGSSDVAVKLLSGKISVRSKSDKKERILLPGQLYTLTSKGSSIRTFAEKNVKNTETTTSVSPTFTRNSDTLLFNKQALSYVFKVLSMEFEQEISFDRKTVEKKFFTGRVIKNRPLERELNSIVLMNQLKLEIDSVNHQFIIK